VRILTALTYYRPHTSGLTIYAERLAKALIGRGHQVTVLTSRYDAALPAEEVSDGVRIVRVPVWRRVSKGVLMPTIGVVATREMLRHDAVHLHLPQFDAAGLALRGRLLRRATVITYHCDLLLPEGGANRLVNAVVHLMNNVAGFACHRLVAYTEDFASHSPFLRRWARKRDVVLPPVELPAASPESIAAFARAHKPDGFRTIGMATRFASEKGVEVLLDAMPPLLEANPRTRVLFAGQHEAVWAEEAYRDRLMPRIRELEARGLWQFLGTLSPEQMAAFYPSLDVLVVPSLNSTESFGLVQIEAMMNGVPVVASDLPGVRQPVAITGMGRVVPVGDPARLAEAVLGLFTAPGTRMPRSEIAARFAPERTAAEYEAIFARARRA
jgi:glycosyltransferase involved in cell wall biosynthesis